jgi:hypothetical protein
MTPEEWAAHAERALPHRRELLAALQSAGVKTMEATAYGMYDGIHAYRSKGRKYVNFWLHEHGDAVFGCIVHWGQTDYPRSWPPEGIDFANQVRRVVAAASLQRLVDWGALDDLNDSYARFTGVRLGSAIDAE